MEPIVWRWVRIALYLLLFLLGGGWMWLMRERRPTTSIGWGVFLAALLLLISALMR